MKDFTDDLQTDDDEIDSLVYENDPERVQSIRSYFDSLDKEDIVFANLAALFAACEKMISKRFGTKEENRKLYYANLKDLYAFMSYVQPSDYQRARQKRIALKKAYKKRVAKPKKINNAPTLF